MLVSESVPYGRNEAMGLMFPGSRPGGQAALPAVYTLEECRLRSLLLPVAAYVVYTYKKKKKITRYILYFIVPGVNAASVWGAAMIFGF